MTEQELVIMFTGMALSGAMGQFDRTDPSTLATRAVKLAVAAVGELKNQGFNWPEPIFPKVNGAKDTDPQIKLPSMSTT